MEAALQQIAQAQKFLLFDELIGEKADQQLRSVTADEDFFKRQVRNERGHGRLEKRLPVHSASFLKKE